MIRNLFVWTAISAFFLNVPVLGGPPYYKMIIDDPPQEAPCLCGQVRIYGGRGGNEGILIEEVMSDFEQVIRSTRSGKNGYFKFPKTSSKKLHYICASKPEFVTHCYTVKISKKVKETMIIEMLPL